MLRRIYIKHIKCSNGSSRLWWNWQFCEKRSENWSRPIPSIGLGRQTTTTSEEAKSLYEEYKKQYASDPFDNGTIETGNALMNNMKEEKKR